MNKLSLEGKIALWSFIVAIIAIIIGVTTPEVRCFLGLQSESCPQTGSPDNSNGSTTGLNPSTNNSNKGSHPSSNPSLDWGNIHDYFNTEKPVFAKGFQKAPLQLSFIVEAKGNFNGEMSAYVYDKDGIKVCPFPDVIPDCSSIGYKHSVSFETKRSFRSFSTHSYYWQTNERDRAALFIPNNVSRVELTFVQSRY